MYSTYQSHYGRSSPLRQVAKSISSKENDPYSSLKGFQSMKLPDTKMFLKDFKESGVVHDKAATSVKEYAYVEDKNY